VHDIDGRPIAGATAVATFARDAETVALPGQPTVRSDDDGAFLVRRALAEGQLRMSCDGYETVIVNLSRDRVQRPYIVLKKPGFLARRMMDGKVTDANGRSIRGASVSFGRQHTKTAGDGRFVLAIDDVRAHYTLTIVAKGWAALHDDDFGKQILAGTPTTGLTFVLDEKPHRMRGRVIDKEGAPVAGAMIFLSDPTLLDASPDTVEARVGERDDVVRTGDDGSFVLDGLGERRYLVRAIDPATGASARSEPWRAADGELLLRLRLQAVGQIRGVVRDAADKPLPSATVEYVFFPHVPKGGAPRMMSVAMVTCDDLGRFAIPGIQAPWLCVRVHGTVRAIVPADDSVRSTGVVRCTGSRWLQLVGNQRSKLRRVQFQMANGDLVDAKDRDGRLFLWQERGPQPIPIPADAVAVVAGPDTLDMVRVELTGDLVVHLHAP
jgi:hypothetical protein